MVVGAERFQVQSVCELGIKHGESGCWRDLEGKLSKVERWCSAVLMMLLLLRVYTKSTGIKGWFNNRGCSGETTIAFQAAKWSAAATMRGRGRD